MTVTRAPAVEYKCTCTLCRKHKIISTGEQYCGGRLDRPSGTFKTPNWPEKDYPAGVTCSWHIVAPKNQVRKCVCKKIMAFYQVLL